jgi:hypothetical protein
MNVRNFKYVVVALCAALIIISYLGKGENLSARPIASEPLKIQTVSNSPLPAFLEKGKTYSFIFVANTGSDVAISPIGFTGRVEKFDTNSNWVFINHYVSKRNGKTYESKYEGYSWINMNLVFQCSEMIPSP